VKYNEVYIGLGSNLGDRLQFLQTAIDLIFHRIGSVKAVSPLYETPAIGFNGPDFLNACCKVNSTLSPVEILNHLKRIEKELGREVKSIKGYTSRVIDLDILMCGDQQINTIELKVPHPRLHVRKFVLQPLRDLVPNAIHPVFQKTIRDLLKSCSDSSEIKKMDDLLSIPRLSFEFQKMNYLAIEGNIGSGKTTLAQMIAEDFNGRLMLERFADNPFLPKFYKNPERYAFTLEMSFLADRYQQISDDLAQLDLFKDFVISDYYVYKSLIFSNITLSVEEYKLYRTLFFQMHKDLPKPDLYIYLYQSTERLQANIQKRGRSYEQDITKEYLERIQKGYLEFLKNQSGLRIKIIDITELDFVQDREHYFLLLKEIESASYA
jgi:2-amino-4-hydroxy-6-hydroxymethyldihydropteridine diphosphokinase